MDKEMNRNDKIINEYGNLTVQIINDQIVKRITYFEDQLKYYKEHDNTTNYLRYGYELSLMKDGLLSLINGLGMHDLNIECNKTRDVKVEIL